MSEKKILLVDNMELALKMEEEILRRAGMEVFTARGGAEALELVKSFKPDLVFLEINMPDMPGDECCRQIRQIPELQTTPVIIMISQQNELLVEQCFAAHCDDVISKPLEQEQVVEKITQFIDIQTRKYARLNIQMPVTLSNADESIQATSINLNQKGILVQCPNTLNAFRNYKTEFSLGPAYPNISLWSRLDRLLAPGEGRNQTDQYYALFRFLSIEDNIVQVINRLAQRQAQEATKPKASAQLQSVLAYLKKPADFLIEPLKQVQSDLSAQPEGISETETGALRLIASSFSGLEKISISSQDETSLQLIPTLALRAKFHCDLRALETLGTLNLEDQKILKEETQAYFKDADKKLDILQDLINAQMQASNLDLMKQLNQSKTVTFQKMVSVKSLVNRITDPKAAEEAKDFKYEGEEESYQVAAYEKAKAIEEEKKKDGPREFRAPKKKSTAATYIPYVLAIAIAIGLRLTVHIWGPWVMGEDSQGGSVAVDQGLKFTTPFPYKSAFKGSENEVQFYVSPEWYQLTFAKRQNLSDALSKEAQSKGYREIHIFGDRGKRLGFAVAGQETTLYVN